jgi:hypothetical protein
LSPVTEDVHFSNNNRDNILVKGSQQFAQAWGRPMESIGVNGSKTGQQWLFMPNNAGQCRRCYWGSAVWHL